VAGREGPLVPPTPGTWRARLGRASCSSSYPRVHPQCVHTMLMSPSAGVLLRCRLMGETPIYDQVRGERINAEVPASGADSQRVAEHGKHRMFSDAPVAAAVFGPPGLGDDLAPNRHCRAWTYPAGLPAVDGQRAATVWGPRAALPPETHTRQAPRHTASSSPGVGSRPQPSGSGRGGGGRGAHPEQGGGVRQGKRTEPQLAAPAGMQFSWFSAGPPDACD
jgi:hypothetical protein